MPPPALPPGLYGMADAGFGDPVQLGRWLLDNGVRVVQLRAKRASTAQRVAWARALVAHADPLGARVLVNDDLEAAVQAGAHGLHLGQEDGALSEARARLGPQALLGRSTHDLDQVRAAQSADYLGFGPIFGTTTKAAAGAPRGLEALRRACAISGRPVVAIGGITPADIAGVQAAGAAGWAVVSALWQADDRAAVLRSLQGQTHP